MAVSTLLPRQNRRAVTQLVMTPVPGPLASARIECTGCPAVMVVNGFPLPLIKRLTEVADREHRCSGKR